MVGEEPSRGRKRIRPSMRGEEDPIGEGTKTSRAG